MENDYRYLLFSTRFGKFGEGDDLEEMVGLALSKAVYNDMIYFLDREQGTFTTLERRVCGTDVREGPV